MSKKKNNSNNSNAISSNNCIIFRRTNIFKICNRNKRFRKSRGCSMELLKPMEKMNKHKQLI